MVYWYFVRAILAGGDSAPSNLDEGRRLAALPAHRFRSRPPGARIRTECCFRGGRPETPSPTGSTGEARRIRGPRNSSAKHRAWNGSTTPPPPDAPTVTSSVRRTRPAPPPTRPPSSATGPEPIRRTTLMKTTTMSPRPPPFLPEKSRRSESTEIRTGMRHARSRRLEARSCRALLGFVRFGAPLAL